MSKMKESARKEANEFSTPENFEEVDRNYD